MSRCFIISEVSNHFRIRPKKFRLTKTSTLLAALLLVSLNIQAQKQMNPSDMDKFVPLNTEIPEELEVTETPVNYYNGSISVSLPLFSIGDNILNQSVSLDYIGKALKMTDIPTWLGAGWHLNVGGSITREIRGISDIAHIVWECYEDDGCIAERYQNGGRGWNLPTSVDIDGNVTYEDGKVSRIGENNFEQFVAPPDYYTSPLVSDPEPDMFYFNFGQYSGSFMFNERDELIFSGPYNIKVETIPEKDDLEWVFRTPDGVKYTFGGYQYVEWEAFGNSYTNRAVTQWHLREIEALTGQKITFTYTSDGGFDPDINRTVTGYRYAYYTDSDLNGTTFTGGNLDSYRVIVRKSDIKVLSKITYYNQNNQALQQLSFLSTADRIDVSKDPYYTKRRLDRINLEYFQQGEFKTVASYEFKHLNAENRLWLESIEKIGIDDVQNESRKNLVHFFEYKKRNLLPSLFREYPPAEAINGRPTGFTDQRDYWDYFNGQPNPNSLIPEYDLYGNLVIEGGANRSPDAEKVTYGMMSKITYPTGGSVAFVYESHDFKDHLGIVRQGGGARIKEIIRYDGRQSTKKVFSYHNQSGTTGKLMSKLSFKHNSVYVRNGNLTEVPFRSIASNIRLSTSAMGSHVGYDEVKLIYKGNDNTTLGSEIFYYHNESDQYNTTHHLYGSDIRIKNLPTIPDLKNGKLLVHEVYGWSAGVETLERKRENTYTETFSIDIPGFRGEYPFRTNSIWRSHKFYYEPEGAVPEGAYGTLLRYAYYKNPIRWYQLGGQLTTDYLDDNELAQNETIIYYDDSVLRGKVKAKTITSSKEKPLANYYQYTDGSTNNIVKPTFMGTTLDGKFTDAVHTTYDATGLPITVKEATLKSPFSGSIEDLIGTMEESTIAEENDYGDNGMLVEKRLLDKTFSFVWGDGGTNLLAKIENATYDEASEVLASDIDLLKDTEVTEQQVKSAALKLQQRLLKALVTAYIYKDGHGVASMIDPNGYTSFYEYDDVGRLHLIRNQEGNITNKFEYGYYTSNTTPEPEPEPEPCTTAPNATISGANKASIGFEATYTAQTSGCASVTSFNWDVLRGQIVSESGNQVTILWNTCGEDDINLTITDSNGRSRTVSKTIEVDDPNGNACGGDDPDGPIAPQQITVPADTTIVNP